MENRLEQVVFVIGFKRRLPGHHFIHQHPEGPPVHRGPVLQLLQDLNSTDNTKPLDLRQFSQLPATYDAVEDKTRILNIQLTTKHFW